VSLTPDEVAHKEFTVTLRGFDQAEVIDFLQTVAADYRRVLEESESFSSGKSIGTSRPLGRLVPGIDASSDDFQAVGDQISEVLRSAAQAAATIRAQARQEAEDMIVAAGERADQLRDDVVAEHARIDAELNERRRVAEEQAAAVIEAADREASAMIARARAHFDELAQGERDIAERLRTAVSAIDAVLADVKADSPETLVAP
jgi:cell division initiation protein